MRAECRYRERSRKGCAVWVIAAVWLALAGCMSDNDSAVTDVSPDRWNTPAEIVYTNRDTLADRRPVLFLRHDQRTRSGEYAVEFHSPSGRVVSRDTVAVETSNTGGYSVSIPPDISISFSMNIRLSYLGRIRLAEQGDWRFVVTPLQNTTGVWSVGINFNRTQP